MKFPENQNGTDIDLNINEKNNNAKNVDFQHVI